MDGTIFKRDYVMDAEFTQEYEQLTLDINKHIKAILLSHDRVSKHKPWSWKEEYIEEHLLKALRHISTHLITSHGFQKPDGENHISSAATRLAMAISIIESRNSNGLV